MGVEIVALTEDEGGCSVETEITYLMKDGGTRRGRWRRFVSTEQGRPKVVMLEVEEAAFPLIPNLAA